MIARSPDDVTAAVLAEAARTPDARQREILLAAVTHLHAFVREARLTEPEFFRLCAAIARAGQLTTASHNEVVLGAGSLGVSALVCLMNNGAGGTQETTANLLGPFWRQGVPVLTSGASIVHSPTPGPAASATRSSSRSPTTIGRRSATASTPGSPRSTEPRAVRPQDG